MVVLDTDVLIALSKGDKNIVKKIKALEAEEEPATTIVTCEEFLFGLYLLGNKEKLTEGKRLISNLKIYDYTLKELKSIIELRLALRKKGKPIGVRDLIIAGICIANNEALFTLNKKHFREVPRLKLV
jgi:predicted nucleic acid-binding protein